MVAADHLQVPRQHGLFQHHGIDLGDGTVAHYLEGKEILRSSIQDFAGNQHISIIPHTKCSPRGVTLRRAMSRIGEQKYNLLFNNCEHFANWCKIGRHQSSQIEDLINTTNIGAKALVKILPKRVLEPLNILFKEGLADKTSKKKAKETLSLLKAIRMKLFIELKQNLEQIDNWVTNKSNSGKNPAKHSTSHALLVKGQDLADKLTALEDLETKMLALLNQSPMQSKYRS